MVLFTAQYQKNNMLHIAITGKDENLKHKLWTLLNVYHIHTITKSKDCPQMGTISLENQNKNIIQGVHEHSLLLALVIYSAEKLLSTPTSYCQA